MNSFNLCNILQEIVDDKKETNDLERIMSVLITKENKFKEEIQQLSKKMMDDLKW